MQLTPDLTSGGAMLIRCSRRSPRPAGQGVHLIVFPETFLPCYPYFSFVCPPVHRAGHMRLYEEPWRSRPGDRPVAAAARWQGIVVVLGVNERDHGRLYNAQLVFDADGALNSHPARSPRRFMSG